jgi:hypothetical protein
METPPWRIKAAFVEKIYAPVAANHFVVKKEHSGASITPLHILRMMIIRRKIYLYI